MHFQSYDRDRHLESVQRIWLEVGWVSKEQLPAIEQFMEGGRAHVAEVDGAAECSVVTCPGTVRYQREDLAFSCVRSVATSRVVRRRGYAGRLTAKAIALDVVDGAIVCGLGMFEQGYYDKLGFGTGSYEHHVVLDPARLRLDAKPDLPRRITPDDWELVHANRAARARGHGAVRCLQPAKVTQSEMMLTRDGFGLGYLDESGSSLTHHLWIGVREEVENGPYRVIWMAFTTPGQLLELLALTRSLGDQVRAISIPEPPGVQLQDLVDRPFEHLIATRDSRFDSRTFTLAYWQMRICDLAGCLARTSLPSDEVRFNLRLTDPIERLLPDESPWRGVAGEYVVTLGRSSGAEPGRDDALPTMEATVNAFTRLWLGVRPASGLAITDEIRAPRDLLESLDEVIRVPPPHPEWDF